MAVLFVFLGAGCSGKVNSVQHAVDFDPLVQDGAKYAVGGFVLSEVANRQQGDEGEVSAHHGDHRQQTDAWSPLLYGPLLSQRSGLDVWSWSALRDNVPDASIDKLHRVYARAEPLSSNLVTAVADDLPNISYLVLARVDRNDIHIAELSQAIHTTDITAKVDEELGVPGTLLNPVKTRRTVVVTVDVFDLSTGRSVWTGTVQRSKAELVGPESVLQQEDLVVIPATEEGEAPEIKLRGASLKMPDLENLLAAACGALVGDLFRAEP